MSNLYYFQQLSYQEISDQLHQPLGTVKSKISRSLKLVRVVLAALVVPLPSGECPDWLAPLHEVKRVAHASSKVWATRFFNLE